MQFLAPLLELLTLSAVTVLGHDGHDHGLQMPMDYVRYPYQAVYPGDNEGIFLLHPMTRALIPTL